MQQEGVSSLLRHQASPLRYSYWAIQFAETNRGVPLSCLLVFGVQDAIRHSEGILAREQVWSKLCRILALSRHWPLYPDGDCAGERESSIGLGSRVWDRRTVQSAGGEILRRNTSSYH